MMPFTDQTSTKPISVYQTFDTLILFHVFKVFDFEIGKTLKISLKNK